MRRRLHTFVKDFLMIRLISVQSGGNTVTLWGCLIRNVNAEEAKDLRPLLCLSSFRFKFYRSLNERQITYEQAIRTE